MRTSIAGDESSPRSRSAARASAPRGGACGGGRAASRSRGRPGCRGARRAARAGSRPGTRLEGDHEQPQESRGRDRAALRIAVRQVGGWLSRSWRRCSAVIGVAARARPCAAAPRGRTVPACVPACLRRLVLWPSSAMRSGLMMPSIASRARAPLVEAAQLKSAETRRAPPRQPRARPHGCGRRGSPPPPAPLDDLGERHLERVLHVGRDLRRAGALEHDPDRAHAGQAAAGLAHLGRDRLGRVEVGLGELELKATSGGRQPTSVAPAVGCSRPGRSPAQLPPGAPARRRRPRGSTRARGARSLASSPYRNTGRSSSPASRFATASASSSASSRAARR